MSELVTARIRDAAGRLHLANLGENLEALVARAEGVTMGYLEFLDLVLEEETGIREGRRFRNALKLSGLPHHKALDEFDFAFQPDLDARKVKDLATLGFVEARANVALLGPPGVGKTMLGVGLAIAACQAGFSIYFTTLDDMVRQLGGRRPRGASPRSCRPASSRRSRMERLVKCAASSLSNDLWTRQAKGLADGLLLSRRRDSGVEVERPQRSEDERLRRWVAAATSRQRRHQPGRRPRSEVRVTRRSRLARPTANLVFAGRRRAYLQSAGRAPDLERSDNRRCDRTHRAATR